MLNDFKKFTAHQIKVMKSFPVKTYHFLIQVTPFQKYHGVEHLNSTVLALGPGYDLMTSLYKELIGVASHELFHTWNIKSIRPLEMFPYNYIEENYSRLGYVAEGVTTYYGDIFLLRSGVFTDEQYFTELSGKINQHFANDGRKNMSVADSSFDTWIDGYVPGIPGRKSSIYTEGALCALMLDLQILRETNLKKSLIDVMNILYHEFAVLKKGYTEDDYMRICSDVAGISLSSFFRHYVYGTTDFEPQLKRMLKLVGVELYKQPSAKTLERWYGIKLMGETDIVNYAAIGSTADNAGLKRGDRIRSINSFPVEGNAERWSAYFENKSALELQIEYLNSTRNMKLKAGTTNFFDVYGLRKTGNATAAEKSFFKSWTNQPY